MPNMARLMSAGAWGPLRSCDPPITVPAWACMTTGKDPGALGLYGFRNRADYSYTNMTTANARSVRTPRVWDLLSRAGKKCVVLGVPQTYPPSPVNGWLAADFLAPDTNANYTYPVGLKEEIAAQVGEYILDIKDFRTDDKPRLLRDLHAFLENRFAVARYLMDNKPWDFFMMVEMGLDRLHHGFWRYCDPAHPHFEPDNPYRDAFRNYYETMDRHIGALLDRVGNETAVLVVSDHGARAMSGGVCVNQWLIREGYLTLRETPPGITRIEDCAIDWPKTQAWSSGGYYARIFINVAGREPEGIVPQDVYEPLCALIMAQLVEMCGPDGQLLNNRVYRPGSLYREVNGIAPDVLVYFGDLGWRSVGSVGWPDIFTLENDTGPDDANHDYHGIVVMDDRIGRGGVMLQGRALLDITPTILKWYGLAVPEYMQGIALQDSIA